MCHALLSCHVLCCAVLCCASLHCIAVCCAVLWAQVSRPSYDFFDILRHHGMVLDYALMSLDKDRVTKAALSAAEAVVPRKPGWTGHRCLGARARPGATSSGSKEPQADLHPVVAHDVPWKLNLIALPAHSNVHTLMQPLVTTRETLWIDLHIEVSQPSPARYCPLSFLVVLL